METAEQLEVSAKDIGQFIVLELQKELEAQGHNATGKLSDEIEYRVQALLREINIDIYILTYGKYQDTGLLPSQIPYSRGSKSGGNSAFISALMKWAAIKKIVADGSKEQRSFAFAVAEKMKKQGMPTDGAYNYTSNGRRTQWLTYTANEIEPKIIDMATEMEYNVIDVAMQNFINQINQQG